MKALKIDDTNIKNLKAEGKVYDKAYGQGFTIRVFPDGRKVARYAYQIAGKRRILTLGTYGRGSGELTLAQLKAEHTAAVGLKVSGVDPAAEREDKKQTIVQERKAQAKADSRITVEKLVRLFEKNYTGVTDSTMSNYVRDLNGRIMDRWADVPVDELRKADLMLWLSEIKKDSVANHVFGSFSVALTFASEMGLIEVNPLIGGKKRPKVKKTRALDYREDVQEIDYDYTELRQFWKNADKCFHPVIGSILKFALLTGKRKSELQGLQWDHIENGVWKIRASDTKAGKVSNLPILPMMQAVLDDMPKRSKYVFPAVRGNGQMPDTAAVNGIRDAIRKDTPMNGMRHFTLHDLRRTLAVHMEDEGFEVSEIKVLLDHKQDTGATGAYLPDNQGRMLKKRTRLLEAWHRKLGGIVGEGVESNVVRLSA